MHKMSFGVLSVFWTCLAAFVITTANGGNLKLKKTTRVVNGESKTIEELPFMVQLRDPLVGTFCGGTLISLEHVLTAAHCFDPPADGFKTVTVVGGTSKRSEPGVQRKIISVTKHPDYEIFYENKGKDNEKKLGSKADVAILKLDKPFEETNQIKVMRDYCPGALSTNDILEVSGWGHTEQINPLSSDDIDWAFSEDLKSVRLPIISKEECSQNLPGLRVSDTNVCAYLANHDSCLSDSGGPGINRGKLCAVVSYGIGCAFGKYPGVYTSIPTVRNFINEQLAT